MRYFFVPELSAAAIVLDEDTSKHITGVLRMKIGDELLLTDGQGNKAKAVIEDDHRKRCAVRVLETSYEAPLHPRVVIAIALVKNAARFEWFLEKATEIGISEIIPLITGRTEKEKFRSDRFQNIITSAMLQSQQCWMPQLKEPVLLDKVLRNSAEANRYIAHCLPEQKTQLSSMPVSPSALILIGPEGDFTPAEIGAALEQGFQPVALGDTRLRTETAGMVAATLLRIGGL